MKRKCSWGKHRKRFQEIFGRSLSTYFDLIYGFDTIKFDDDITKSSDLDDISMADVVKEKYGEEAVSIIESLIG